jgi:hypothetical protein
MQISSEGFKSINDFMMSGQSEVCGPSGNPADFGNQPDLVPALQ